MYMVAVNVKAGSENVKLVYNYNNTIINVYIDKYDGGQIFGRIISPLMDTPIFFTDAGNMLLQIEGFLDKIGYPCAFQKMRSFFENDADKKIGNIGEKLRLSSESLTENNYLAVIGLRVTTRQNASWQGVAEIDGNKIPFKSALQFLKMVYEFAEIASKAS